MEEEEETLPQEFEKRKYGSRGKEVAEVWNVELSVGRFEEDILLEKEWRSFRDGNECGPPEKQAALKKRLERYSDFESHDYDALDNRISRKIMWGFGDGDFRKAHAIKWATALAIGCFMGVVAFLINYAILGLNEAKFQTTANEIADGGGYGRPFGIYVGMSVGFLAVAAFLVCFVEPLAAGSGIPELKVYLNGVHLKSLLCLKTFVAKIIGVLFSISGGLIAGKEGPFIHSGGIVGAGLGTWSSNTFKYKIKSKYDIFLRNSIYKRDFVGIGTAVGVATAFSAPVGGMLFTMEEGATYFNHHLLWKSFVATSAGVVVLQIFSGLQDDASGILTYRLGNTRDFGLYNEDVAAYGKEFFYFIWEIPIFVIMGIVGGLAGALFVKVNVMLTFLRRRFIPQGKPWLRFAEVVAIGTITNIIFFSISFASPCDEYKPEYNAIAQQNTGSGIWTGSYGNSIFPQLWCPAGTYSRWGQLFFQPLAEALKIIIHIGEDDSLIPYSFNWLLLLMYAVICYVLMIITYGIGAATGLFVPSLTVGAAAGRLIGKLVKVILKAAGSDLNISLSTYAVVGAASSLGGVTRMTISITVLVAETTASFDLLPVIMASVFFSKLVGDWFGLGIYDAHIRIRGAPVLEEHYFDAEEMVTASRCSVKDIMAKANVVSFDCHPTVREVISALAQCRHGAFPVFDCKEGHADMRKGASLLGSIRRTWLVKIIKLKLGLKGEDKLLQSNRQKCVEVLDKLQEMPFKADFGEDSSVFDVSEDYLDTRLNLLPYLQAHPYLIVEDAPVSRAYYLMRELGLRHVFVTRSKPAIVGMLSRKDIMPENVELALEFQDSYEQSIANKDKTV